MLLAEIDRQVYYLPITVVFGAVLIAALARWCWPPDDDWVREVERRDQERTAAAQALREQVQR